VELTIYAAMGAFALLGGCILGSLLGIIWILQDIKKILEKNNETKEED
jgi:hypothetical protein